MTTTRRDTPSFGTRGFFFALILAFIFYLLASEMVSHHFFSGGAPDSPKTLPSWTPFGRRPFPNEPPPQLNTMALLQNEFSPPAGFPNLILNVEIFKKEMSASLFVPNLESASPSETSGTERSLTSIGDR
jgi:hypothetical protein